MQRDPALDPEEWEEAEEDLGPRALGAQGPTENRLPWGAPSRTLGKGHGSSQPHLGKGRLSGLSFGAFSLPCTHGAQRKHPSLIGGTMLETSCPRRNAGHCLYALDHILFLNLCLTPLFPPA